MVKEIAIFKTDSEDINVEVIFEDETVWLTQEQMAQMFEKAKSTINEHIKHIFEEGELEEAVVVKKFGNSEFQQKAEHNSGNGLQNVSTNISAKGLH